MRVSTSMCRCAPYTLQYCSQTHSPICISACNNSIPDVGLASDLISGHFSHLCCSYWILALPLKVSATPPNFEIIHKFAKLSVLSLPITPCLSSVCSSQRCQCRQEPGAAATYGYDHVSAVAVNFCVPWPCLPTTQVTPP